MLPGRRKPNGKKPHLAPLESFQLFQRSWPVRTQEPGQTSIRKNFPSGLAARAIICFLVCITNSQNLIAASWTGFAVAPMNCHSLAKRRNFFRELSLRFGLELVEPMLNSVPGGGE